MMLHDPVFFTDYSNLAKARSCPGANSQAKQWEIRRHSIEFQNITTSVCAKIFHIK
jgi:hypothetical protein